VVVALADLELLIEQKGAEILINDLPTIEVIQLQMNQLFYNLLGNALKFSKKGTTPKIEVNSRKLTEREVGKDDTLISRLSYVEITVKDNGIGFDQKYEDQIFTVFQRLSRPLEYEGTGLGLAMVKRVVDNHHGKIFATSTEGEGATFTIILPTKQTV
jgi:two-component system CheB/CheR fusion protein